MKIRTITFFYLFKSLSFDNRFLSFLSRIENVRKGFEESGIEVQTVRLTSNAADFIKNRADVAESVILEDVAEDFGITFLNYGLFNSNISMLPELFNTTKNVSASTKIVCKDSIDIKMIKKTSAIIKDISNLKKNKNFNYCVSMNIREHTPFYPASFASEEGFSIGYENGDIIGQAFKNVSSYEKALKNLIGIINKEYKKIEKIAYSLAKESGLKYLGVDTSFAPGLKKSDSVFEQFDYLKKNAGIDYLSTAGLLTDAAKRVNVKRAGYSGLMLPVCEDISLAKKCDKGEMTIERILLLSSVCGCGLDTVPVSGNITAERISSILLNAATLSYKWQKPLSVRLLPVYGKRAGERTSFNSPHLVNSIILE
jgi:hypothetical protein